MHSRIGCIWTAFLQSDFLNGSSKQLPKQMQSCIGCICTIFHLSEFSNVPSNGLPKWMRSRIGYICAIFLQSEISNAFSNCLFYEMHSHIGCIYLSFLYFSQNNSLFQKKRSFWRQNVDCLIRLHKNFPPLMSSNFPFLKYMTRVQLFLFLRPYFFSSLVMILR